jgi:GT2 family glycosyltransferase
MQPCVSIITINYNQLQVTCALLDSLRKVTYAELEVIVVDNHSTTDPSAVIASQYPEVKLIVSNENLGFAGGNNLGIRACKGDYILFLNNDTEVEPGFIEPLIAVCESHADAGIASPNIL